MKNILFFNFDGTDNEPADAMQDKRLHGKIEDDSITNILKFHLLLGGSLTCENGQTDLGEGSKSFYYNGIGTYGNFFQRKFNAGLAREGADVATILNKAKSDFENNFNDEIEYIVLTGFSRGAALARRFAAIINHKVKRKIIIEGVFDTVASIGLPNLRREDRPESEVLFEQGCTLPPNVLKALHIVSLDDKRKAFQPTLMNTEERILEIWFAGAHGDVGGGYNFDGLSDNALRFFLDWFEELELPNIRFKSSKNIDYKSILPPKSKLKIDKDDVQINPNPFGINHQQQRLPIISHLTLSDRLCCIINKDAVLPLALPLVHWSVADRILRDSNYQPKSLHNQTHIIVYQDGEHLAFDGISDHRLKSMGNIKMPTKKGIQTKVYAHLKYNHTGIYLVAGKKYKIEVIDAKKKQWRDGSMENIDGKGWDRDDVKWGLRELPIKLAEPFRRVTKRGVKWFTLCGCIGTDDKSAFVIGNKLDKYSPTESGELCAFANDLDGYYGNNSGCLRIRVAEV